MNSFAPSPSDPGRSLRRSAYLLLIVVGCGTMIGRILSLDSVDSLKLDAYRVEQAAGDLRARLRERGFGDEQIERRVAAELPRLREKLRTARPFLSANDRSRWCTLRALVEPEMRVPGVPYAIDRVVFQPGWDTIDMVKHDGHLYSSKPPLWPTLLAGQYWLLHAATGATLGTHPYTIGRTLLIANNVVPLALLFLIVALMAERFGRTDFGRIFVVGAAVFGTLLTTFSNTLNNHIPAAVCAAILLESIVRIVFDGDRRLRWFVLAGLFGTMLVTLELPALAMLAAAGLFLLKKAPKPTLAAMAPAALLVMVGFFLTNWIAHKTLAPAYSQPAWYDYTYERDGRVLESYWRSRQGVDRGETSRGEYLFHSLVGHHGVFSLTPIWLLSAGGLALGLSRRQSPEWRQLALLIAAVTLVVFAFYMGQKVDNRNYGGMTAGLRWMFWFAPLWLLSMIPALDRLAGKRWGQALALTLLGLSALSAAYPTWNPWTHPWLFQLWMSLG